MAKKIKDLQTPSLPLTGGELLEASQDNVSVKITSQDVKDFATEGLGGGVDGIYNDASKVGVGHEPSTNIEIDWGLGLITMSLSGGAINEEIFNFNSSGDLRIGDSSGDAYMTLRPATTQIFMVVDGDVGFNFNNENMGLGKSGQTSLNVDWSSGFHGIYGRVGDGGRTILKLTKTYQLIGHYNGGTNDILLGMKIDNPSQTISIDASAGTDIELSQNSGDPRILGNVSSLEMLRLAFTENMEFGGKDHLAQLGATSDGTYVRTWSPVDSLDQITIASSWHIANSLSVSDGIWSVTNVNGTQIYVQNYLTRIGGGGNTQIEVDIESGQRSINMLVDNDVNFKMTTAGSEPSAAILVADALVFWVTEDTAHLGDVFSGVHVDIGADGEDKGHFGNNAAGGWNRFAVNNEGADPILSAEAKGDEIMSWTHDGFQVSGSGPRISAISTDLSGNSDKEIPTVKAVQDAIDANGWTYTPTVPTTGAGFNKELTSSIPAGTTDIEILLDGVSDNSGETMIIQIGDSGGYETTGYSSESVSTSGKASNTKGYRLNWTFGSSLAMTGVYRLSRWDVSEHLWFGNGILDNSVDTCYAQGQKTLSGELTSIRLTLDGLADFDAGNARVRYR